MSDRDIVRVHMLVVSGIRTVLYEQKFNHGAKDGTGWDLKAGIFGLPRVDPRDGKDFLAVMHSLTDDTLRRRYKPRSTRKASARPQPHGRENEYIETKRTCARDNKMALWFERNDSLRGELADRAHHQ
jgi:hypothetical protein